MTKSAKQKMILKIASLILHVLLNIIFYVLVVLVVMRLGTAAYEFAYQLYGDVSVSQEPGSDVKIKISQGEGTMELASSLEYKGLIKNKYAFFVRAKLTANAENPILAGTYTLNTSMNFGEILRVITDITKNEEPPPKETKEPQKKVGAAAETKTK